MNEETKLTWLKRVLIFKILIVALLWGLPTWIAPESILKIFGETLPTPPFYMRIFGATQIGMVFLYWLAYQNPVKNRDMIRYAVVDNTVAFLTIMGYAAFVGITNPTVWISACAGTVFRHCVLLFGPKAGLDLDPWFWILKVNTIFVPLGLWGKSC